MNPLMTEVTTGATDALLGLEAMACAALVWGPRQTDLAKARIWLGVFGLLALVSILGAIARNIRS